MAFWCCQAREEEQELVVDDFLFKGKQPEAKLYSDAPSHQESFGSTVDADVTGDADDSTSALSDPSEPPACLQQDIARALQSCRLLEAKELLSRPENDKEIALAARLDVLARQYEDSQRILNTPSEEMTVNDRVKELNFEYGMSLETHGFRLVVNVEWHLDSMEELLRYAALYISKDCHPGWDVTVRETELLGDHGTTEALWRVRGVDGVGVKTDDILRRSWLIPADLAPCDAWLVEASDESQLPVAEGHVRQANILNFTTLAGRRRGDGFALKVKTVLSINPGAISMAMLRLMPRWALRRALGGTLERAVRTTPEHIQKHATILDDVVKGPAAPFFTALMARILSK